jgi:hypothetical protein
MTNLPAGMANPSANADGYSTREERRHCQWQDRLRKFLLPKTAVP